MAVARACSMAWMRGCPEVRAHSVPPMVRPVVSRACSTRRTLCAASRASATSPFGWRSKAAPQSISSCDVGRSRRHQDADRIQIAQAVAGGEGVLEVQLRSVVVADRRGDAALRVAGVALGRRGLGEQQHVARRRQFQRGAKGGDAAADDEVVRGRGHGPGAAACEERLAPPPRGDARQPGQLRYPSLNSCGRSYCYRPLRRAPDLLPHSHRPRPGLQPGQIAGRPRRGGSRRGRLESARVGRGRPARPRRALPASPWCWSRTANRPSTCAP